MREPDSRSAQRVDQLVPWFLLLLAGLAAAGAVIRRVGGRDANLLERVDETTLLYLAVGGALLLLRQIKSFSFGSYKLEMLEQVREKQVKQQHQIDDIALILPFLLPKTERKHLINLARNKTAEYRGNGALRAELRRLRSIGLLRMRPGKHVGHMKDNLVFDLAEYMELTTLGEPWVRRASEVEEAEREKMKSEAEPK